MSTSPLAGRVALVTGGASGIGRATVLALAAEGANVAIVDRTKRARKEVAGEATQSGVSAREFLVDLADSSTIEPLVNEVLREFGRIDILVNSAAVSGARTARWT